MRAGRYCHFLQFLILPFLGLFLLFPPAAAGQTERTADITLYGSAAYKNRMPFWQQYNRHGIFSQRAGQAAGLIGFHQKGELQQGPLSYSFGITAGIRTFDDASAWLQEAYGKLWWGPLELAAGNFYQTVGRHHRELSSGSFGIGDNARPMPKIRAGLWEFVTLPLTFDLLEIRAHIAHGWFEKDRFTERPWLHEKSGYVRIGRNHLPVSFYAGLTHFGIWGGTSPQFGDMPSGFRNFWRIFFVTGGDPEDENLPPGDEYYMFGDSKGFWDGGIEWKSESAGLSGMFYHHIPIEDKDGLKLKSLQDGLWGASFDFGNGDEGKGPQWVKSLVYEYIYTKWQNGPDGPGSRLTGAGGWDNYYNHAIYRSGWSYRGRSLGTPLFHHQNDDFETWEYGFINNRIVAHHIGISGITPWFRYRSRFTWSRNYGTYWDKNRWEAAFPYPFEDGPKQFYGSLEFIFPGFFHPRLTLLAALSADAGQTTPDTAGALLGVRYRFME